MTRPKVAAVILNYRTPRDTLEAVTSLEAAGYENLEVIVVDNAPKGEWSDTFLQEHPRVIFLSTETNLGFSGGCNVGIRRALEEEADYVLLLNSDALAGPEMVTELVRLAEIHDQAGILGPVILFNDHTRVWYQGGTLSRILGYTRHPGMGKSQETEIDVFPTDFVPGTAMFIRRAVFEEVGLLDEDYFLYVEDVDLSERARRANFEVVYCPSAIALHKVSASAGVRGTNILTPLRAYYFARNMILFIRKNMRGLRKFTSLNGQIYVRAPYYVLNMFADGQPQGLWPYLQGIWDGLLGRTGKWAEHDRLAR